MLEITAFSTTIANPRRCTCAECELASQPTFPLVVREQQVVHRIGRGYVRLSPEAVIVECGNRRRRGLAA